MANIDDAFRVEVLSLDDLALVGSGLARPNIGAGYEAPQGSLYLRQHGGTEGELYVKFGPADVDWQEAGSTSGSSANLWETIIADAGSTIADSTTDSLTIAGGTGISTTVTGDTLTIDSTTSIGDLSSVTVGVSSPFNFPLTFANVVWDTIYVENNTGIIEHDNSNNARILIKETGLYFVNFSVSFDADSGEEDIHTKIVINDTTDIPGSLRIASEDDEINDISNAMTAELTAGDYITLQVRATGNGNVFHNSSNFSITRAGGTTGADGLDGPPGPPGSGSSINVLDEGVSIPNSPHTALNFIGDYVTAMDAGSGQTNVTITNPIFGTEYQTGESPGVTTTTSTAFLNKFNYTTTSLPAGKYRVGLRYQWNHNNAGNDFEGRFREDGSDVGEIHKQEPKDSAGGFSTTGTSQRYNYNRVYLRTLTAGTHYYEFDFRTDASGTASSVWEVTIEIWRVE